MSRISALHCAGAAAPRREFPSTQLCAEALGRSSGVLTGAGFEGREEREGISGRDSTERMLERSQLIPWVYSSLPAQHKGLEPLL